MTSPFVELYDNTAAGNNGAGFTWYLLGLDDDVKSQSDKGKVIMGTHRFNDMPKNAQNILVDSKPKRWYSAAPNEYIHQDLPLFEKIDNNMAYANHVGMRIRYVANINLVAASSFHELNEPDKLENYIKGETNTKKLHVHGSLISNTTLLNNEIGLHSTYSSNIKYEGLEDCRGKYRELVLDQDDVRGMRQ